jgi:eukaryotic-like serine/threonine-protein kinase
MNPCGGRMGGYPMETAVTLTIQNGDLAGTTYEFLESQTCLIGRGNDCAVRLPNDGDFLTVSRHHCLLTIDPPAVGVRDCGSRNGTYLNGMQIGHPWSWPMPAGYQPLRNYDLVDGDELRVGDTIFQVSISVIGSEPGVESEMHRSEELCACA